MVKKLVGGLLLISGMTVALCAQAIEVYTWVDDEGHQHFSQKPPLDIEYESISPKPIPPPPAEEIQNRLDSYKEGSKAYNKTREERAAAKVQLAEKAAEKKALCDKASKMNETLTIRRRVTGPDGAVLTDQQRAEQLQKTADLMKDNCQ